MSYTCSDDQTTGSRRQLSLHSPAAGRPAASLSYRVNWPHYLGIQINRRCGPNKPGVGRILPAALRCPWLLSWPPRLQQRRRCWGRSVPPELTVCLLIYTEAGPEWPVTATGLSQADSVGTESGRAGDWSGERSARCSHWIMQCRPSDRSDTLIVVACTVSVVKQCVYLACLSIEKRR